MQQQKIQDILTFLNQCKKLETTKRYSASLKNHHNTVAEHSWRLALMVIIIATKCDVKIDTTKALSIALLHDIAESETGDIDAYEQIINGKQSTDTKIAQEEVAIHTITDNISFGHDIYNLWREYEDQDTLESKFVRALDKIEGFLYISEVGVDAYIPKEFHADYANKAVEVFDEVTHHFPELADLLEVIKMNLKIQFQRTGVKWIDTKDNN